MAEATLRRCIGSARFGIEAHEAPIEDFPKQPSQKDGLGRMCREHWSAYTAGLARDAKARKAAEAGEPAEASTDDPGASPAVPEPSRKRRRAEAPVATADRDAG